MALRYCDDLVKRLNYPSWLALNATITNSSVKSAVLTVLAFDAEISKLSQAAKTPAAVEIRYEFWLIGLEKLLKGTYEPNGHPLLDSLSSLNVRSVKSLHQSLINRSANIPHPLTLNDFDSEADRNLLPIYAAVNEAISNEQSDVLVQLARAQLVIRKLRGLQAVLNGKRSLHLNDFIPFKMQQDRVKLFDIVKAMVGHAQACLDAFNARREHKFFQIDGFCSRRWLETIEAANFDLRSASTLRIGTRHDGLLPLLIYLKSFSFWK